MAGRGKVEEVECGCYGCLTGRPETCTERKYRPACKKPCNQCPFRRQALPGWLGSATPESFVEEINRERPLPCHPTIDYDDRNWLRDWIAQRIGKVCAGSLVFSANIGKLPRDRAFPRLNRNTETVFATVAEFVDFHRNAPVRSWEM